MDDAGGEPVEGLKWIVVAEYVLGHFVDDAEDAQADQRAVIAERSVATTGPAGITQPENYKPRCVSARRTSAACS